MKTIPVYTAISDVVQKQSPFTLHNRKRMPRYHSCRYYHRYLDGGRVYVLGAVEWGIYLYISMGKITSMMLLFTRSSRMRRANVGSYDIIFKSLCFGLFTLKQKSAFKLAKKYKLTFVMIIIDINLYENNCIIFLAI